MKKILLILLAIVPYFSIAQVGISTSSSFTPTSLFDVEGKFQINSSGDIIKINNLSGYTFPTSHVSGVLSNNGTGTLTWSNGGSNFIQNQVAADQTSGFRITGNGLFSSTSKVNIGSINIPGAKLEVHQETGSGINTRFFSYGTVNEVELRRSQGSLTSPTIIGSGGVLGRIWGMGHDGTTWRNSSNISFEVDAVSGANDMPGRITFWTALDGTITPIERMRIGNNGNVGIGTTTAGSTLTVNGTIAGKVTTYNGTASFTLAATDHVVYLTGLAFATRVLTLPTLTSGVTDGRTLTIKNIANSGSVYWTLTAAGGNTLVLGSTYGNPLTNQEVVILVAIGTTWHMISYYN